MSRQRNYITLQMMEEIINPLFKFHIMELYGYEIYKNLPIP